MIATTACGSSDEKFFPEDFAILDQFVDRTTKRCSTFIYHGAASSPPDVCHVPVKFPFCWCTCSLLLDVSWDYVVTKEVPKVHDCHRRQLCVCYK